jgi:hypothetical protein
VRCARADVEKAQADLAALETELHDLRAAHDNAPSEATGGKLASALVRLTKDITTKDGERATLTEGLELLRRRAATAKDSAKAAIVSAQQQQVARLSEDLDRRRDELLAVVAQKIGPELAELAALRLRRGYLLDEVHAVRVLMESLLDPTPPVKRRRASELLEV